MFCSVGDTGYIGKDVLVLFQQSLNVDLLCFRELGTDFDVFDSLSVVDLVFPIPDLGQPDLLQIPE